MPIDVLPKYCTCLKCIHFATHRRQGSGQIVRFITLGFPIMIYNF